MTTKMIIVGALLAGCVWAHSALACSCRPSVPAGFIHKEVARLPANARGALFLPPPGDLLPIARYGMQAMIYSGAARKLMPSSFSIKSDTDIRTLEVRLTWLDLDRAAQSGAPQRAFRFVRKADQKKFEKMRRFQDWRSLLKTGKIVDISAEVRAASRLLRVGPAGGFQPGSHYIITYLGESAGWDYPAAVEHTIDSAPLQAEALPYSLVADGPPLRRLLALNSGGGSCSSNQPAIVQDFHYAIPDAAKPYQNALLFFSEFRTQPQTPGRRARFTPLKYEASLCGRSRFGESATGMGRELMELPCEAPGVRRSVRGWAGLLEVEDRLHRTDPIEVDPGLAAGRSCRGIGMLTEAIKARDAGRTKAAACALMSEERREVPFESLRLSKDGQVIEKPLPRLTPQEIPAASDLLALASADDPEASNCGRMAMTRLFMEEPVQNNDLPERLGDMLKAELDSLESARIDAAVGLARALSPPQPQFDKSNGAAGALYQRVLLRALPALVEALVSGKSELSFGVGDLVASTGAAARPFVPVLLKAASGAHPPGELYTALNLIAADDPAYHALLIRNAADPALREASALSYYRVAGKTHPQQAIALLAEAARHGSIEAIDLIGDYGPAARSHIPVLVEQLDKGADEYVRGVAFGALLKVGDGEPELAAAVARGLTERAGKDNAVHLWPVLNSLKAQDRLWPAIALLMQGPLAASDRNDIASIIQEMKLPRKQTIVLLARLAKVKTVQQ